MVSASFHPTRRAVARVLSTFLCCIIIVIPAFSRLGGTSAFLVLTLKELVFSVQEDLAQQLEATVLNVMGAFIGVGISTLAKYIASISTDKALNARLIPAVFLVAISFFAGWIKSRLPRLQLSTRISCFVSIWILTSTNDIGPKNKVLTDAGNFLWIAMSAAVICLFSSIVVLRWSSTRFAEEAAAAFSDLHKCLSLSLDGAFSGASAMSSEHRNLHEKLLKESISLNATYSQAAFELRVGRVGVKSIKPLIGIVENIRRELSWGMAFPRSSFAGSNLEESIVQAFQNPALDLASAILSSMAAAERVIRETFQNPSLTRRPLLDEKNAVTAAKVQLLSARRTARNELRKMSDSLDMEQRKLNGEVGFPSEFMNLCLFMISLLQMAHEMHHALQISYNIACLHENSRPRLWHPHFSWAWLGVAPRTFILDERSTILAAEISASDTNLSPEETRQGLVEHCSVSNTPDKNVSISIPIAEKIPGVCRKSAYHFSFHDLRLIIPRVWRVRGVLRVRLGLSKVIRAIQHSSHLRHALKNAAGVALLGFPAFLPTDSAGQKWFKSVHGQWMIISFVWVLETNTGATWRVGYLRLSGTTIGAIYAYVTWLICHTNPYGLIAMVTLADVPVSWLIINTSIASLGVVADVTLPPIVFSEYVNTSQSTSILKLAILRGLMIGAGIVVALAMNSLIFPRHCRVLFLNNTSRTLGLLSQLYMTLGRDIFDHPRLSFTPHDNRKTLKLEVQIRNALHRLTVLITTMNDELSLVPKPMRRYGQVVQKLQKILDLMTGLRKVRENIPRRETVASVFKERREMISCICVSLFACEQVFRARQPLPQFLPSSKQALRTLEIRVEERIRQAREEDGLLMGLSLVYAFAESEVMEDIVDTLEELLDLSRQLFGTSAWLTIQQPWPEMSMDEEMANGSDGWYSALRWEGSTPNSTT